MKIESIVIGNEILSGRTQEGNAHNLAKTLAKNSYQLDQIQIIKDDIQDIALALDIATKRSDLIIISGGLGPTQDDMTKNSLAQYFKKELSALPLAMKITQENYKRFNREWNPELNFYHLFPKDFIPLNNPQGLAPGLLYFDSITQTYIYSLPGVPREFNAMVESEVLPKIKDLFGKKNNIFEIYTIKTRNIPEELIFGELCPLLWKNLEYFGQVSSLPNDFGVDILIKLDRTPFDQSKKEIYKLLDESKLKPYIWQIGDLSLPEFILSKLETLGKTVSIAESCTGGLISDLFTNIPGSSQNFHGSIISYTNQVKHDLLHIDQKTLTEFGAISEQTASKMALGVRSQLKTDYALSITGIAGPGGGTKEKPIGLAWIGVTSLNNPPKTLKLNLKGSRVRLKQKFAQHALFFLLEQLPI